MSRDVTKLPVTKLGRPPVGDHVMTGAERMQRQRAKGVTEDVLETLTGPWLVVAEHINTPCPGMPNLERLQRISGSLGKYADQVWYGLGGLTMSDIGKVIGTQPAMYPVG